MKFNIKYTIEIGLLICLFGKIKISETLSLYGLLHLSCFWVASFKFVVAS